MAVRDYPAKSLLFISPMRQMPCGCHHVGLTILPWTAWASASEKPRKCACFAGLA
jgi:hypothetical protein